MVTANRARALADAASRIQKETTDAGLVPPAPTPAARTATWLDRYDEIITNQPMRDASRTLFADYHYARAVEAAFKRLNNEVKTKSGLASQDGDSLMRTAFSANEPMLRLNSMKKRSEKDEQKGYMDIFAGAMSGIRNPRAHEHDLEDAPEVALELLVLANHLMRKVDAAKRARQRKKKAGA